MFIGCTRQTNDIKKEVNIAVILSEQSIDRWTRIFDWVSENISNSSNYIPNIIFYDENSCDLMLLAYELANDESIDCVIGCENEENTDILAYQMSRLKVHKPMFTFNTAQSIIRKYSEMNFMWGFCESDITQSEILVAKIATYSNFKDVILIANNTSYGQAFIDWFAFQAYEYELNPKEIIIYNNIDELKLKLKDLSDRLVNEQMCEFVCVPNSVEETLEMIKYLPFGFANYSHKAFSDKLLPLIKQELPDKNIYMSGITLVPNPSSGFQNIYQVKYNEFPIFGEAQLYDAIMVACMATALAEEKGDITINDAVALLLENEDKYNGLWIPQELKHIFIDIENGNIPIISGATGTLNFSKKYSIIENSVYALTYYANNQFYQTDYITRDGSHNTSSISSAWEWNKFYKQEFNDDSLNIKYSERTGNKAVIIATSTEWENYRHQADALVFYQLLKSQGFTDDEIIFIIADDLAYNKNNPYPGEIISPLSEDNLYENIVIDYKLSEIKAKDLKNILVGKPTDKLTNVLNTNEGDNIFFFWSGHGKPNCLLFGDDEKTLTGEFMHNLFSEMYEEKRYRKICAFIETCYAGSVAKECEGIPGILFMTAANEFETSKAFNFDIELNTYTSNSFTISLYDQLEYGSYISIKDLYYTVFDQTVGSHVTIYNAKNFGSLSDESMSYFMFSYDEDDIY